MTNFITYPPQIAYINANMPVVFHTTRLTIPPLNYNFYINSILTRINLPYPTLY